MKPHVRKSVKMAYKTKELEEKALKAIIKHQLVFIDEVVSYLPCCRATFYLHGLDKLDTLKDAIEKNKDSIKAKLRKKWGEQNNATTEIALYKLLGTKEERNILSNVQVTGGGGGPIITAIEIVEVTKSQDEITPEN